jgi:hypothetical protein
MRFLTAAIGAIANGLLEALHATGATMTRTRTAYNCAKLLTAQRIVANS